LLNFLFPVSVAGVQLENWRSPFYAVASEMEYSTASPSRMFWDDIEGAALFDTALWPDSRLKDKNYYLFEPSVLGAIGSPLQDGFEKEYWHIDILNSIRFRNFSINQTVDVDKRYNYDAYYPAHRERSVRGRIEEANIKYEGKFGFLRLGRLKRNWGPFSDRSLIVSSNPYSYDAVEIGLQSSLFEFRHLFAPFSYEKSSYDTDFGISTNRYLSAHSLNLILGKWVTVGVSETVVFSRQN
jgi:hypothetical protein